MENIKYINNTLTISNSLIKLFKTYESNYKNINIIYLLNLIYSLKEDESIKDTTKIKLNKLYNILLNKYNLVICKVNNKDCLIPEKTIKGNNSNPEIIVKDKNRIYHFLEVNIINVQENLNTILLTSDYDLKSNFLNGTTLNLQGFGNLYLVFPGEDFNINYTFYDSLGNDITNTFVIKELIMGHTVYVSRSYYTTSDIYIKINN